MKSPITNRAVGIDMFFERGRGNDTPYRRFVSAVSAIVGGARDTRQFQSIHEKANNEQITRLMQTLDVFERPNTDPWVSNQYFRIKPEGRVCFSAFMKWMSSPFARNLNLFLSLCRQKTSVNVSEGKHDPTFCKLNI